MALKVLCGIIYILIFIPVWLARKLTRLGRFESRFHNQDSTWDVPTDASTEVVDKPVNEAVTNTNK